MTPDRLQPQLASRCSRSRARRERRMEGTGSRSSWSPCCLAVTPLLAAGGAPGLVPGASVSVGPADAASCASACCPLPGAGSREVGSWPVRLREGGTVDRLSRRATHSRASCCHYRQTGAAGSSRALAYVTWRSPEFLSPGGAQSMSVEVFPCDTRFRAWLLGFAISRRHSVFQLHIFKLFEK